MINLSRLLIDYLVDEVQMAYHRNYSNLEPEIGNMIGWTARLALENIANSNALYHNLEHTVMVTMAGQAIIEGKHLIEGGVTPKEWLNYMIALLCHDIGYVRGILQNDNRTHCATGIEENMVELPDGGTDIVMTPYHVDRSKQFVRERFGKKLLGSVDQLVDVEAITEYIEMTRFPPHDDSEQQDTSSYASLTRAADFIGQLGDPDYLRKTPALFYEFEETDANQQLGYNAPGDLRKTYAAFFWKMVNPYIQDAIRYLSITQEGKQWIASLYAHVFTVEHAED
ncbi:MAG: metal-dependent phosphohydrolase [candidate division Zixibacteria bacterium]|nr:metal-dependent phosphohydrolase [Gammaproteobacteria bacterium]NIX58406.1 metal-dependent phosphohydrolase [candidate division Zixibacteria bacterium]